ncbi:PocR ligand-binding domain-containing protein [Geothrix sp. 21YS21S-2]|uniref:PocR ligand-binding domain-containing protein n=1 Tax=Geothrix sp. 21YS21S-2 TaxID=3068893 RepID=UPI0027B96C7E|nr:PocR ligand-binding domain-containing protein [Geothrix sp. 21YS21S-2]
MNLSSPWKADPVIPPIQAILDVPALRALLERFRALTGAVAAVLDLEGRVVVETGGQDVCLRFHKVHPGTAALCGDCRLRLVQGAARGERVAEKCGNGLWDVVTPLYAGEVQIGSLYTGQFLYDDEEAGLQDFRARAGTWGFDAEDYLAAAGQVPRFSRDAVRRHLDFLLELAGLVTTLNLGQMQSETRHRALFDTAQMGIVYQDTTGFVLSANEAAQRILGRSLEDMQGTTGINPLWRFIREDFSEFPTGERPSFLARRTGRPVNDVTMGLLDPGSGAIVWLNVSSVPLFRPGEAVAFQTYSTFKDITRRKEANAEVARLHALLRESQALARVGGWEIDLIANTLHWTEETYRIHETSPGEFTPTVESALSFYAPESLPKVREAVRRSIELFESFSLELELITAKGRKIWVHATSRPVQVNGRTVKVFGAFQDISARKEAEATLQVERDLLQAVMDGAPNSLLAYLDRDFRYLRVNSAYAARCGCRPEELVGLNHFDLHPDPVNALAFQGALEAGETREARDQPIRFRESAAPGTTFWDWTLAPVKDPGGQVAGLVWSLFETTSRLRAEEALRHLNEELERRVSERTGESEQLASELRALVAELAGTEQRERKHLADILHDHLQQFLVAARLQLTLVPGEKKAGLPARVQVVDSILQEALAASRSLAVELCPPVLSQAGLVPALVWLAQRTEESSLFRVHVRAGSPIEPRSETVRFLLFQSVRELLLNAVKHSGGKEAWLTLDRLEGGWIRITVEDRGRGFPPGITASRTDGSFGLFNIRQRLGCLGGRVEIESHPDQGVRVTLLAPEDDGAGERPAAPVPASPPAGAVAEPAGAQGSRIRILLVDDHRIMREGLLSLLQIDPDLEVVGEAQDGQQGLDLARQLKPDVVVTDLTMPVMDGLVLTRILHREMPATKILGLSMSNEPSAASAMREAGAAGYLTKGGPSGHLIRAIRACKLEPEGTWVT